MQPAKTDIRRADLRIADVATLATCGNTGHVDATMPSKRGQANQPLPPTDPQLCKPSNIVDAGEDVPEINTVPTQPGQPDPYNLHAELLLAFGWQSSSHPPTLAVPDARKLKIAGPAGSYSQDLQAAGPLLQELVSRLRALRSAIALPKPWEYEQTWRSIIVEWNEACERRGWDSMPRICDNCGTPVFLRAPSRLRGGGIEHSSTCSPRCQSLAKTRKYRAEKKERGEPV